MSKNGIENYTPLKYFHPKKTSGSPKIKNEGNFRQQTGSWRGFCHGGGLGNGAPIPKSFSPQNPCIQPPCFSAVLSGVLLGTDSTRSLASLWFGAGHTAIPQGHE